MKIFISVFITLLFSYITHSQEFIEGEFIWHSELNGQFGLEVEPLSEEAINPITYQGEYLDFSGGYALGDQVADFTLWNSNSESFNLRTLLEESSIEGKYTILISGSNSCIRFTEFFNQNNLTYVPAIEFMNEHIDDFNWKVVYGIEAHPIDSENCASNCPITVLAGPSGVGEFQHTTVASRDEAVARWTGINDGTIEVPEFINTYTPGIVTPTGQIPLNYVPSFPNIDVWPDNPENLIYDSFFRRPFGMVILDCSGVVVARADWFGLWILDGEEGEDTGMNILLELLESSPTTCSEWVGFCEEDATDDDGDGLCNNLEAQNGTDANDPCSPYGDDTDFDGLCDGQEIALGTLINDWDTDDDGVSDADEVEIGTDPLDPASFTSIEEIEIVVSIFPNPSTGVFRLESVSKISRVQVYNTSGTLMTSVIRTEDSIDLSNLEAGVYFLKGKLTSGHTVFERLIKE